MEIKRTVKISADDSEFTDAVDRMGDALTDAFDRANDSINKTTGSVGSIADKVKSKFSELENKTSANFKNILKDSEKYNKSVSDRIRFMEKEVKMMERLARGERDKSKQQAQIIRDERFKAAKGSIDPGYMQYKADEEYKENLKNIESKYKNKNEETTGLRQKLSEFSDQNRQQVDREDKSKLGGAIGTGRVAGGAILGAIGYGFLTSLAGILGKVIDEGVQLNSAKGKASGVGIGDTYDVNTGEIKRGIHSATEFGVKDSEMYEITKRVALGSGKISGSSEEAFNQVRTETGLGLDQGSINGLSKTLRASVGSKSAETSLQDMLKIMKSQGVYGVNKNDFSLVPEKLQDLIDINEKQTSQREGVNNTTSSELMTAFAKIGGSFSDFRQKETMSTINNSIVNPGNDFKQAAIFRALKDSMPGASGYEIRKKQEEGIFGEGTLKSLMTLMTGKFEGETLYQNIHAVTGLRLSQSEVLAKQFAKNPKLFNGKMSNSKMDDIVGSGTAGASAISQALSNSEAGNTSEDAIKVAERYASKWAKSYDDNLRGKEENEKSMEYEAFINRNYKNIEKDVNGKSGLSDDQKEAEISAKKIQFLSERSKGGGFDTLSTHPANFNAINAELLKSINYSLRDINKKTKDSTNTTNVIHK